MKKSSLFTLLIVVGAAITLIEVAVELSPIRRRELQPLTAAQEEMVGELTNAAPGSLIYEARTNTVWRVNAKPSVDFLVMMDRDERCDRAEDVRRAARWVSVVVNDRSDSRYCELAERFITDEPQCR